MGDQCVPKEVHFFFKECGFKGLKFPIPPPSLYQSVCLFIYLSIYIHITIE